MAVELLPDNSPLWDLENVIITPHFSDSSQYRYRHTSELFCEHLKRYRNDEPLEEYGAKIHLVFRKASVNLLP